MSETRAVLSEIGHEIATQDGRVTAHPYFIVQELKRDYGYDHEYAHKSVWYDPDDPESHVEGDAPRPGKQYERVYYNERWEFVQAFLTEKGAKAYIRENAHRHSGRLRDYCESAHRNDEIQALRAALAPTPQGEPDIDENSFREGYEWGFGDGSTGCVRDPDKAHKAIAETYALGLKPEYRAINRADYRAPQGDAERERPAFVSLEDEYPDGPKGDYLMLRDAVIQFLGDFIVEDDVAEVSILMDAVRDAGLARQPEPSE